MERYFIRRKYLTCLEMLCDVIWDKKKNKYLFVIGQHERDHGDIMDF